MRWRPAIGPAESVVAGEEGEEAVQSAAGGEDSWWGAPGRWQWCLGAAAPAESPPGSGSGGPASGHWTRGPAGAAEVEGAESRIAGRHHRQRRQGAAAAGGGPGPVAAVGEAGPC